MTPWNTPHGIKLTMASDIPKCPQRSWSKWTFLVKFFSLNQFGQNVDNRAHLTPPPLILVHPLKIVLILPPSFIPSSQKSCIKVKVYEVKFLQMK